MPNLDSDPQRPSDLLGRPIAPGDIVAWGTTWGQSAALCIARIEKIRFHRDNPAGYGASKECPQSQATGYSLWLRPIKSTGSVTETVGEGGPIYYEHKHGPRRGLDIVAKVKSVKLVKNVVKLEAL